MNKEIRNKISESTLMANKTVLDQTRMTVIRMLFNADGNRSKGDKKRPKKVNVVDALVLFWFCFAFHNSRF